jgi:hypothetical protein
MSVMVATILKGFFSIKPQAYEILSSVRNNI